MVSDPTIGLAAFVLLNRGLHWNASAAVVKPLRTLGVFSYSLYLIHVPVQLVFEHYVSATIGATFVLFRFVLVIPLCVLLARVFFELFEKPMLPKRPQVTIQPAE